MREFQMASKGGGELRCGFWAPAGKARAVVQLVHGIAEHIGRYDEFAKFLADQGFAVVADDHMGHGKSVADGAPQGYFSGGWLAAVEDEKRLMEQTRAQYPDAAYFLLGHSMGSFLTRSFLWKYPDSGIAGAILSGTGWQPAPVLALGRFLCRREEKRHTDAVSSDLLQKLMFGAYNHKFAPARTEHDWICTDPGVVDAYCADPMCGFRPTIGLARDMLWGIGQNQKKEHLRGMDHNLPVWFFSGENDPVGDMGRGVKKSAKAFRAAGMKNVTCTLYPTGRHEMLNEPTRFQVFEDVRLWLEAQLLR